MAHPTIYGGYSDRFPFTLVYRIREDFGRADEPAQGQGRSFEQVAQRLEVQVVRRKRLRNEGVEAARLASKDACSLGEGLGQERPWGNKEG